MVPICAFVYASRLTCVVVIVTLLACLLNGNEFMRIFVSLNPTVRDGAQLASLTFRLCTILPVFMRERQL